LPRLIFDQTLVLLLGTNLCNQCWSLSPFFCPSIHP